MSAEINNSRQTVTAMAANTQVQRVLELVRQRGIVRGTELDRLGVHRMYLKRLVDRGLLVQRSRGIYEAAKPRISEHDSVIEVAVRVPRATLCLLTALRLHQLTTQNPFEVWIMIDRKARKPSMTYPPIRVVRASGFALSRGVNAMRIDGVEINVTTVAKTVADCFKYRSTVGVDVAIEALRDAWRQKKVTVEAIIAAAKIDRVATVMRPYLESLV
jgi:predicted transcriptional regulator of viral defense system